MSDNRKMNKTLRYAYLVDAMGGGLCKIHGPYLGHGSHGVHDCPFCDIDAFYATPKNEEIKK